MRAEGVTGWAFIAGGQQPIIALSSGRDVDMWPNGARCAVVFTFDFDAEELWIGEDPANANRPGVCSQGTFGAKVGVPALLKLLDKHGLRATFFVPGRVAERHHDRVTEIVADGHELAHHGYTHTSPSALTREEEEAELVKAKEVLESFGTAVTGYRSPSGEFSAHTLSLLDAHGIRYSSNLLDDLRPYRHPGTSVVELPVHWMLDDAPHFWFANADWTKKIATTAEVRSIWEEEFRGIREVGGLCIFTMHPQIIGRPSRMMFLEDFIRFIQGEPDVWLATCNEVATTAWEVYSSE